MKYSQLHVTLMHLMQGLQMICWADKEMGGVMQPGVTSKITLATSLKISTTNTAI